MGEATRIDVNSIRSVTTANRRLEPAWIVRPRHLDPGQKSYSLIQIERGLIIRSAHHPRAVFRGRMSAEGDELTSSTDRAESRIRRTGNPGNRARLIITVDGRAQRTVVRRY